MNSIRKAAQEFRNLATVDTSYLENYYGSIEAYLEHACSYDPDGWGFNCYLELKASETRNGLNAYQICWFDPAHPHNR